MEEQYVDYDDLTDGQAANHDAGWRDMYCPKCGYESDDVLVSTL